MKFHIPFTFSSIEKLRKRNSFLKKKIKYKKNSKLQVYLNNTDTGLTREEYLSIVISSFINYFIILHVLTGLILFTIQIANFYVFSLGLALVFTMFVTFSQNIYPKIYVTRKEKNIEKNLIPALEDILIQLNSGVPLFSILVNISASDYGQLSIEFKKVVRRINAGFPQVEVIEELGEKNSSIYFRRTLWQISNGLKAGSDLSIVIKDTIKSLNEEQLIQIQNYGNKLNPIIMFYMLIAVIIPALSITFLTVLASLVSLSSTMSMLLFMTLFVFVIIVQVMFLGAIKSMRPSLL